MKHPFVDMRWDEHRLRAMSYTFGFSGGDPAQTVCACFGVVLGPSLVCYAPNRAEVEVVLSTQREIEQQCYSFSVCPMDEFLDHSDLDILVNGE